MNVFRYSFQLILFFSISFSQNNFLSRFSLDFSGSISYGYMSRLSNGNEIKLPYNIFFAKTDIKLGIWDLTAIPRMEFRNGERSVNYSFREIYLSYYPKWGEVKFGKQINFWGRADGINPIDNLNPYDQYYLFSSGPDKKIGIFSVFTKIYFQESQIEVVINPKNEINRMILNEPDFPLSLDAEPLIEARSKSYPEIGLRYQRSFDKGDLGLSFFISKDRTPSILIADFNTNIFLPKLGYRNTKMFGFDFVTFLNSITLRSEIAFFQSASPSRYDISTEIGFFQLDQDISSSQYIMQLEYLASNGLQLNMQLIGNYIFNEDYDWVNMETKDSNLDLNNSSLVPKFNSGMGTPFAIIFNKSAILAASGFLLDRSIEIQLNGVYDLNNNGVLIGLNMNYSFLNNWKLKLSMTKFHHYNSSIENPFFNMRDFSNIRSSLNYMF